jgi:hypothetical protein
MDSHGLLQNGSNAQAGDFWILTSWKTIIEAMPPVRILVQAVLSAFAFAESTLGLLSPVHRLSGNGSASAVCNNPQLSCHNATTVDNLCCFNSPGGSLLQTQFWDTDPATGPEDSWTIHGLWVSTNECRNIGNMELMHVTSLTTAMEHTSNSVTMLAPTQTSPPSLKQQIHRFCNT